jgi:hypothetical protein
MISIKSLAITGVIVALAISFSGGLKASEAHLSKLKDIIFKHAHGSIATPFNVSADQTLQDLYKSATLSFVSNGDQLNRSQILSDMKQDNPQAGMEKPFSKGGIYIAFPTRYGIIICSHATPSEVRCVTGNFKGGGHVTTSGRSLKQARLLAVRKAKL